MLKLPPTLLAAAIKRQWLVPRDFILPGFDVDRLTLDEQLNIANWGLEFLGKARSELGLMWVAPGLLKPKRDFDRIMRNLPEGLQRDLRERAKNSKSRGERFWLLARAYDEFCQERKVLNSIVHAVRYGFSNLPLPAVGLRVIDNKKGKTSFDLEMHPLYTELVRTEVEPQYIRECQVPKCNRIFWAGRTDQTGCLRACQQAIRDRRYWARKKEASTPSPATHQEKRSRVLQAIREGCRTREAIFAATRLSVEDDIPDLLAELIYVRREVELRNGKLYPK